VPGEEHADAAFARDAERLDDLVDNRRAVRDLTEDADLHVVYDQGEPARIARVFERAWNIEAERVLHDSSISLSGHRIDQVLQQQPNDQMTK
jgi:hypothetical protein